jgi:hypothetical protein
MRNYDLTILRSVFRWTDNWRKIIVMSLRQYILLIQVVLKLPVIWFENLRKNLPSETDITEIGRITLDRISRSPDTDIECVPTCEDIVMSWYLIDLMLFECSVFRFFDGIDSPVDLYKINLTIWKMQTANAIYRMTVYIPLALW